MKALYEYNSKLEKNQLSEEEMKNCVEKVKETMYSFHLYSYLFNRVVFNEKGTQGAHTEESHHCHHENVLKDKMLHEIRQDFLRISYECAKNMQKKEGTKKEYLQQIEELSKQIEHYVYVLSAYGDQMVLLDHVYTKTMQKKQNMEQFESDEMFAKKVTDTILASENNYEIREDLRYVYTQLPVRFTMNKFQEFIDGYFRLFKGATKKSVQNHIKILKDTAVPESVDGFMTVNSTIGTKLIEAPLVLQKEDQEKKQALYHELLHIADDKNEVLDDLVAIQIMLNHLQGMLLTSEHMRKEKDIKTVKALIAYEESDKEQGILLELADYEEDFEKLLEEMQYVEGILEDIYCVDDSYIPLKIANKLASDVIFLEEDEYGDEVYTEEELQVLNDEFTKFLKSAFKKDIKEMKRTRMSVLLGIFQAAHHSGQQIYEHIYNAISLCDNKTEKILAMQSIYAYINQVGEDWEN